MVFKLMEVAQKRWIKIRGLSLLTLVSNNVKFVDGVQVSEQSDSVPPDGHTGVTLVYPKTAFILTNQFQ